MYLLSCRSFKSAKKAWVRKSQKIHKLQLHVSSKKDWARKSQIREVLHLGKVRKSKKFCSANLGICDLRNLFTGRPPLKRNFPFFNRST